MLMVVLMLQLPLLMLLLHKLLGHTQHPAFHIPTFPERDLYANYVGVVRRFISFDWITFVSQRFGCTFNVPQPESHTYGIGPPKEGRDETERVLGTSSL